MPGTVLGYQEECATVSAPTKHVVEWRKDSTWGADWRISSIGHRNTGGAQRRCQVTESEAAQRQKRFNLVRKMASS